jgi:hypothetical protein
MATTPIGFKSLTKSNFTTVDNQSDELVKSTGMNLQQLMAEAIATERQKMLTGSDSRSYIKLLTTVFGKFSVGAPQHVNISNEPFKEMTREELGDRIQNLLARRALSEATPTLVSDTAAAASHTDHTSNTESRPDSGELARPCPGPTT